MTAINLREGDAIETMDGMACITKIVKERHEEPVPVYNFHVKEWASYFVGEVRVYVHNGKGHVDDIKISEKNKDHIFRNSDGHFLNDTPENRSLLEHAANDKQNCLGTDMHGNEWYAETLNDGKQIWATVRNNEIRNGGINNTPKTFNPKTGLSSPNKPTQK